MASIHPRSPFGLLEFSEGHGPGDPFEDHREQQHGVVDNGIADGVGIQELAVPLVEGDTGAHGENHDGDDECPEIELAPVTERVQVIGRLL